MGLKWKPDSALCVTSPEEWGTSTDEGSTEILRKWCHELPSVLVYLNSWATSEMPSQKLLLLERGQSLVPETSPFVAATLVKFYKTIQAQRVHLSKAALPLKLYGTSWRKLSILVLVTHTAVHWRPLLCSRMNFPTLWGRFVPVQSWSLLHVDPLFLKHISWCTKEQGSPLWSQSVSSSTTLPIKQARTESGGADRYSLYLCCLPK